jgi:hypothetical protein
MTPSVTAAAMPKIMAVRLAIVGVAQVLKEPDRLQRSSI